jgi:hypothetical protein
VSGKIYLREALQQELSLFGAADSGENLAAHAQSNGNGSLADASGTGVDQNGLTGLHATAHNQRVVALKLSYKKLRKT